MGFCVSEVRRLCAVAIAAGSTVACGAPTSVTPTVNPATVVPTSAYGPVQISFVSATPPPGSTITGCGTPNPTGCVDRLGMTFLLRSSTSGHVRSGAVYLFDASSGEGCLGMFMAPTELVAGEGVTMTLRVDVANNFCPMPLTVDRMTFTIYDDPSLRSQQQFQVRYAFFP